MESLCIFSHVPRIHGRYRRHKWKLGHLILAVIDKLECPCSKERCGHLILLIFSIAFLSMLARVLYSCCCASCLGERSLSDQLLASVDLDRPSRILHGTKRDVRARKERHRAQVGRMGCPVQRRGHHRCSCRLGLMPSCLCLHRNLHSLCSAFRWIYVPCTTLGSDGRT